ncbi:MAG: hypothetical protein CMJ46_00665 [Planctomyces sp.]|nr:hypothetical protein [Planctomyces sp.]
MLCAGLMLVMTMTGCYHCSYKYNPCTGITEQQCKKVGFWCKWFDKDKPNCGSCAAVEPDCTMPMECSCEAPHSCGYEMPATCGCGFPQSCSCEMPEVTCSLPDTCGYPPSCACAYPETCGCGFPETCGCAYDPGCGYPVYESAPAYGPSYDSPTPTPAPKADRGPTYNPAPVTPPEDPAATQQMHYTVPHRHHR